MLLETLPRRHQSVLCQDGLKAGGIQHAGFDELEQPGFVLGTSGLERDGGEMFVTGEGSDALVVVYPFHTPEIGNTVLAGHAPGAMDVSEDLLFIASPRSGDVSILTIDPPRVIAVVPVGSDPGFIRVTPDGEYALVLNRKSGDMAILSVPAILQNKNRYKTATLRAMIPVGSRPVSVAVRAV